MPSMHVVSHLGASAQPFTRLCQLATQCVVASPPWLCQISLRFVQGLADLASQVGERRDHGRRTDELAYGAPSFQDSQAAPRS